MSKPIGAIAEGVLAKADREGRRDRARVVEAWLRVAGPEVARHSMGAVLREGEFLVYVDGHAWANELSAMAESFRVALEEEVGKGLVRSLRFTVSKRVAERDRIETEEKTRRETYRVDRVEPVPLTARELAAIEESARAIADPALREAAVRVAVMGLEREKGLAARRGRQTG
ncbi:MAG: DUF721 domain-containing protein [Coriobacteriia bacterium]